MWNATSFVAIGMPQGWEWIVLLAIAVLIFGRRLPDIARSVGKSITEFKKGVKDTQDSVKSAIDESKTVIEDQEKKKNESGDQPRA